MKYIEVAMFPEPDNYDGLEIAVGCGNLSTAGCAIFSLVLALLAFYQGGSSTLGWAWWQWWGVAIIFVFISIVIHEFLHILAHPEFGISGKTKYGVGIVSKIPAFWVGYADWVSCKRAIFILLLPFVVLVIVGPLVGLLLGNEAGGFLSFVGAANAISSRKDVVTSISLIRSNYHYIFESERGYFHADTLPAQ